jgi:hypothetical protein
MNCKGRARDTSADLLFEQALLGDEPSNHRSFDPREERKTRQLCQQVKRALILALAGQCDDDILRDVYIDSVEPMGSASQLLVTVTLPAGPGLPSWEVLARLNERSARLRALVAGSICRKRAPGLSFTAIPEISNARLGDSHE